MIWVFWGQKAKKIKNDCGIPDKCSIVSSHPSPFSANYGFIGSKPFSKINKLLLAIGKKPID